MSTRIERPLKRINPGGDAVWVARYTDTLGRRKSAGTFRLKHEAQAAINGAYRTFNGDSYGLATTTMRRYLKPWLEQHPRKFDTALAYEKEIRRVLETPIEGHPLGEWPMKGLRRRHMNQLVDHLFREQKRGVAGVKLCMSVLSALFEDAISDDMCELNPARGMRIRQDDPRSTRESRETRVYSFEEMHAFARLGGRWEAMLRTPGDTGVRLGELLGLRQQDFHRDAAGGYVLEIRQTVRRGRILQGTKHDHDKPGAGRVVPVPPGLAELLLEWPKRIDTSLLFPASTGVPFRDSNFRTNIWDKARAAFEKAHGVRGPRPHECRHSYITHLAASGVDRADLARMSGHTLETANKFYVHSLDKSADAVRRAIG